MCGGARGTGASLYALRHLMNWAFPRVLVTEVWASRGQALSSLLYLIDLCPIFYYQAENDNTHVYSDDNIRVQALLIDPESHTLPADAAFAAEDCMLVWELESIRSSHLGL